MLGVVVILNGYWSRKASFAVEPMDWAYRAISRVPNHPLFATRVDQSYSCMSKHGGRLYQHCCGQNSERRCFLTDRSTAFNLNMFQGLNIGLKESIHHAEKTSETCGGKTYESGYYLVR